jgi:hypothetical protein
LIPPVILSDAILDQVKQWAQKCRQQWWDHDEYPLVGEAVLDSPVDGLARRVCVHLAAGFIVKAKTFVGIRSLTGAVVGAGNTIILNRDRIGQADSLHLILLHEMTHAVDPYFEDDFNRLNPGGRATRQLGAVEQYYLVSEQRAFPAMWTLHLREDLQGGKYHTPQVSVAKYREQSVEFRGFLDHTPDLAQQTTEHFRRIAEDLKRRRAVEGGANRQLWPANK